MAQSLAVGITAIKDTATSATALKTALQQAFDSSLNSAKTVGDFQAIKTAIEQAGVSAQLSAEQQKILNAGLTGGAEAVKTLKTSTEQATTATTANTQATQQNTEAKQTNAQAGQDIATSNEQITSSTQVAKNGMQNMAAAIAKAMNDAKAPLEQFGASAEEVNGAFEYLNRGMPKTLGTFGELFDEIGRLGERTRQEAQSFKELGDRVDEMGGRLNSANVSAQDLAEAQNVLSKATRTSIGGMIHLDQSKLDNLKAQIDQAKAKLEDLADSARQTADSLEGELARMQGNDAKAQELENAQKLADLQKRLDEARTRGNAAEINELNRALELQRKINSEKMKQTRTKSSSGSGNVGGGSSTNNQSQTGVGGNTLTPDDIVNAFDERTRQQLRDEGGQLFAEQLMKQAKMRAR